MQNINGLIEDLKEVYKEVREEKMSQKKALTLTAVSGKIIYASVAKMKYNELMGNRTIIKFMED